MHILSGVQIKFSSIDYRLYNKTSVSKFKKVKIILSIFSDHNGMNLEINDRQITEKNYKYLEIKQHIAEQLIGPKMK